MAKKKTGNERVVVKFVGENRAVVYGKYMYTGETREMSRRQADALVKAYGKKNFKILGDKKKPKGEKLPSGGEKPKGDEKPSGDDDKGAGGNA